MSSNNQTVILVLATAAAAVALFLLLREDKKRREGFNGPRLSHFERDFMQPVSLGSGRFWRSQINYIDDITRYPHYLANKHDESLPLEMSNLAPGLQLIPPYEPALTGGQYTPGPNDYVNVLPDDLPTRMANSANGNQAYTAWLSSAREDGTIGDYPTALSVSRAML